MKIIETLSEKISEEIHDAESYAQLAIETREAYPDLSRTLYELSVEEMGHMSRLHTAVAAIIEQYRKEKGEPPAAMMAVYEYLHKQQIGKAAEAKAMQSLYNEG